MNQETREYIQNKFGKEIAVYMKAMKTDLHKVPGLDKNIIANSNAEEALAMHKKYFPEQHEMKTINPESIPIEEITNRMLTEIPEDFVGKTEV